MPAISGPRKAQIKRDMLAKAKAQKAIRPLARKRAGYLEAVTLHDMPAMRQFERQLITHLATHSTESTRSALHNPISLREFIEDMRIGIPFSNAIHLLEMRFEYLQNPHKHIETNPRFRKPNVLRQEMEILEYAYHSLQVDHRNARKRGLTSSMEQIARELERIAKKIVYYNKIFSSGKLVEH